MNEKEKNETKEVPKESSETTEIESNFRIESRLLRYIFDALHQCSLDEVIIRMDGDGWTITAVDPPHILLFSIVLSNEDFESYPTIKTPIEIEVDTIKLLNYLKTVATQNSRKFCGNILDLKIIHTFTRQERFERIYGSTEQKLVERKDYCNQILFTTNIDEFPFKFSHNDCINIVKIPELNLPLIMRELDMGLLRYVLSQIKQKSDAVKFQVEKAEDGSFWIYASSNPDANDKRKPYQCRLLKVETIVEDKEIENFETDFSMFALDYIEILVKIVKNPLFPRRKPKIDIILGQYNPIEIKWEMGHSKFHVLIAPRLES